MPDVYRNQYVRFEINQYLPIIGIPENKTISFLEWFKTDIYESGKFIHQMPQVFDEGYIFIERIPTKFDQQVLSDYIKKLARLEGKTFREVENLLLPTYKMFLENVLLHFKFGGKYKLQVEYVSTIDNGLLGRFALDDELWGQPLYIDNKYPISGNKHHLLINNNIYCDMQNGYQFQKAIQEYYVELLASALWYISLYKNKYKYETPMSKEDIYVKFYNKKPNIHHNTTQRITTSFYDLSKTPMSKVSTLAKKRDGFEYSHQFDVRGHYRHYKSGKVIFIKSFTKANDKPRLQKHILLEPKN